MIERIDSYQDSRFSQTVLNQHGAYLISGQACEVEIVGKYTAVLRGDDPAQFRRLAEEFRFHAPHITRFLDEGGAVLFEYAPERELTVALDQIQPSQFYIDAEKLNAVRTFVHSAEDIVIQVLPWEGRYISLDGHTRLYLAVQKGWETVRAVASETDDWIWTFVREARRRGINSPKDLILLPHERYTELWDRYCDEVFAREAWAQPADLSTDKNVEI